MINYDKLGFFLMGLIVGGKINNDLIVYVLILIKKILKKLI